MKNLTKLFVAVAALFAFSCATDATEDLGVNVGGQTTLTLSLEDASKTQLGEKVNGVYHLYWSEGDQISVNGVPSVALTAGGSAEATFSFNGTLEYPYNVVYPASEGANEVTFLASQSYTAGSFCAGAAPMCGYAEVEGGMVQLQHLAGVLRFDVSGTSTLSSLTVMAKDIAGTFAVDCATGALTAKAGETLDSASVSFGEGLALGAEATPIYVAVPAGVYGEVSVVLYSTAGEKMVVKFDTTSKPISAGKVREFKAFEFAGTIDDSAFVIDSKDALIRFAANPSKSAVVVANIDMTGVEWNSIEGFAHSFDGGDFAIKGLNAPLFGTTTATEIKNVKLTDVNIVETANPTIGAIARTVENVDAEITNCSASGSIEVNCPAEVKADHFYTAGLIGKTTTVKTVSYLTNAVDVTVNGNTYSGYYTVAGCVGTMAGAELTHSTNLGAVTMNAKSDNTLYVVGLTKECKAVTNCANGSVDNKGVLGTVTFNNAENDQIVVMAGVVDIPYGDVTNTHNYGNVTMKGKTSNAYLLGIARNPQPGLTKFSNCTNYGKLTIESASGVANLAGITNGTISDITIEDCHNYGDIEAAASASFSALAHIAGIIGSATDYTGLVIKSCSNSGNISTYATHAEARLAGILGSHARNKNTGTRTMTFESLTNTGNITIGESSSGSTFIVGGVVGLLLNSLNASSAPYTTTDTFNGKMYNSGKISYYGETSTSGMVRMAGVIGLVQMVKTVTINGELVNDGEVLANTDKDNKYIYAAGVIATINSVGSFEGNAMITNNAKISITASNAMNTEAGGCINAIATNDANAATKPWAGMTNNGAVYVKNTTAGAAVRAAGCVTNTGKSKTHNVRLKGKITNNGTITVDGSKDVTLATIHAGGTFAQVAGLTGYYLENCEILNAKTGVVTVTANVSSDTIQVAGIAGNITATPNNDKGTASITNNGNVNILGDAGRICAGGVFGIATKNQAVPLTNTGNVTCRGTYDSTTSSGIGGIVGSLNSGGSATITGARCFCDVEAVGYACVGMITGFARSSNHYATKTHVGGRIALSNGEDGKPEYKILAKNYVNGPYDEDNDSYAVDHRYVPYYGVMYPTSIEADVAKSDKCGYISAIDATPVDSNGESLE